MDGWIKIGTKVDTSGLDKDLKNIEKRKTETLEIKTNADTNNTKKRLRDLSVQIEEMVKNYNLLMKSDILSDSDLKDAKQFRIEIEKAVKEYEKISGEKLHIKGFENAKNDTKQVSKSMTDILKKVAKWGLAIFGVRSAYNAIRSAMSTLTQYDKQLATDMEYIRYVLANALKPVIEWIMKAVQTILTYINYIAKAWFGKEIFASAEDFARLQKSAEGTTAAVKETRKQLAGFDEMNVLDDNVSSASFGGATVTAPSFDLGNWDNIEIPSWIKWIADNKDIVIAGLTAIAGAIAGIKFAGFIKGFSQGETALKNFKNTLSTAMIAAGIAAIAYEVINLIKNWDNMTSKEKFVSAAVLAIGAAFITLGVMIRTALDIASFGILEIISLLVALAAAIAACTIALTTDRAEIMNLKDAQEQLTQATQNLTNANNTYINAVDRAEEAEKALADAEKKHGITAEELLEYMEAEKLTYQDLEPEQRAVYKAYMNNVAAQENLTNSTNELKQAKNDERQAYFENELAMAAQEKDYDRLAQAISDATEEEGVNFEYLRQTAERAMSQMNEDTQKTFLENIPDKIKKGLDPDRYKSDWDKLTSKFNKFFGTLGDIVSGFFKSLGDGFSGLSKFFGNDMPNYTKSIGSQIKSWFGFSTGGVTVGLAKGEAITPYSGEVVKMASGSVINQPGRGVPMSRAIGGEAGAEGIIPLTNNQAMSYLGEQIGKNVVINFTNITQLDNRQLAREQKIINARNEFATNR